MVNVDIAVSKVLRKLREGKGMSQEDLAWQSGLHRTYISQLERAKKSVTVKTLFKICKVLEIDSDLFLKEVNYEIDKLSS